MLTRFDPAQAVDKRLDGTGWGAMVLPGAVEQAEIRAELGVQIIGTVAHDLQAAAS
jgi:hypothetical protein